MELPDWPEGTVLVLATAGDGPHAIPVSAAVRAGPARLLLGLARTRGSLERLRADPRVALCILADGLSITVHGRTSVLAESLVEGVAAVEVSVTDIQDHDRPTFEIHSGVSWGWTDAPAGERDEAVRLALARLV